MYRVLLSTEMEDLSFVLNILGDGRAITRVMGEDLLLEVRMEGENEMQNGIDGFLRMEVMLTLLVVYLAIGLSVLYFQLQKNAMASPVTIYQCARQEPKRVDLETSSSEIRIESDDEGEETISLGEGDMVSTKTPRHDSMDSEMEGNAGLEI